MPRSKVVRAAAVSEEAWTVGRVLKLSAQRIGAGGTLQVVGFAVLWLSYGAPRIADILADLQEQGFTRAHSYKLLKRLREFHTWLVDEHGYRGSVEDLARLMSLREDSTPVDEKLLQ